MSDSCNHKWRTTDTVSHQSYLGGATKFSAGFNHAKAAGIDLLAARRKECVNCQIAKTTVELDWSTLKPLLPEPRQQIWEGEFYPDLVDEEKPLGWRVEVETLSFIEDSIRIKGVSNSGDEGPWDFDVRLHDEGHSAEFRYRNDNCIANHSENESDPFKLMLSIIDENKDGELVVSGVWDGPGKTRFTGNLWRKVQ
ncbi:hypothetical protein KV580_24105 [Pseudomonas chlororaphis]|nr:hypothetical protein [Pseudomonas chlororaphis]